MPVQKLRRVSHWLFPPIVMWVFCSCFAQFIKNKKKQADIIFAD